MSSLWLYKLITTHLNVSKCVRPVYTAAGLTMRTWVIVLISYISCQSFTSTNVNIYFSVSQCSLVYLYFSHSFLFFCFLTLIPVSSSSTTNKQCWLCRWVDGDIWIYYCAWLQVWAIINCLCPWSCLQWLFVPTSATEMTLAFSHRRVSWEVEDAKLVYNSSDWSKCKWAYLCIFPVLWGLTVIDGCGLVMFSTIMFSLWLWLKNRRFMGFVLDALSTWLNRSWLNTAEHTDPSGGSETDWSQINSRGLHSKQRNNGARLA